MNGMSRATLYDSYPLQGDIAVLCEGDVAGYEVSLLKRWTSQSFQSRPLVDVWAAGTAESLFGLSDALGRSRPIVVIEDRDFRDLADARSDCERARRDRLDRDVRLLSWRPWHRNEIENYFLDAEVLLPSMAYAFQCSEGEVQEAVSDLLPALAVFQSAQFALYHAFRGWKGTTPASRLRANLQIQPFWDDTTLRPTSPPVEQAKSRLEQNLAAWQRAFRTPGNESAVPLGSSLVADFERKHAEWAGMQVNSSGWKIDWSGKDVLQWLRITLSARHGWRDPSSGQRSRLAWEGLGRAKRDTQDRPLETAIKPLLVDSLLKHLRGLKEGVLFDEWMCVTKDIGSCLDQAGAR